MVKETKVVRTYLVSMHDLRDNLNLEGDRVAEVKIITQNPGLDDPVLEITTVEIASDE